MNKQLQQVREFQKAFEQTLNYRPSFISQKDAELRSDLAIEEIREYDFATETDNMVEILDALVDQAYILFGTVNAHGLQEQFLRAFDLVHENNMSKLDENGNVLKNEHGKVIKPKGFKPVDLKPLFDIDASFRVEPIKIEE